MVPMFKPQLFYQYAGYENHRECQYRPQDTEGRPECCHSRDDYRGVQESHLLHDHGCDPVALYYLYPRVG